ncbi:MAG: ATP-dependent DNA helicase II subunit 1 [Peltula sp. TS41687]|nr:MAG: ATP-dependent DNA helicase II subunit 1 [Peltula sp. TS41687]
MAESANWQSRKDDAEDEEEEVDESGYKTVKDAVLFAIEVNQSMLTPPPKTDVKIADVDAPVSAALKCAYQLMQQRIISHPNDMIGILLFGTEKSKFQGGEETKTGGLAYPHCYLLLDLDVPSAGDVKALRSIIEDEEDSRRILVPSKDPVSMANVLFCANQIFTTKAANFSSRRLFIVTDNDNPHAHDKALRSAATVRAKDLYDLGVTLDLFPISRLDHEFDRSLFYEDIIYNSLTDADAPAPLVPASKVVPSGDGVTLLNSLLSSINSKAVPRRALFSNLALEIGSGCKISVKGFILFKRQTPARSCYVWLGGEKAQIAKGVTTQVANDVGRPVEKREIRKAYKFGGEQVAFTPEEVSSLRNFGDPIIRIIGFKPMSMLPIWASLKQSTFIYPSEEEYVGSTRVFSALQQKLLKDEKMAVAWFIARKNAAPVIAALIPGPERLGDHNEQIIPPGMWVIPLPYADDIRHNPETTLVRSPDSLVDTMRVVMQQLQLPKAQYSPGKYPNPALQWHYRILQAMALDEDLPDQPEDKTIPKYRQVTKRAGEYIDSWTHELEKQFGIWRQENRGGDGLTKRPATSTTESLPKRPKTASGAASTLGDDEMKTHCEKGTITKLTVPVLKDWMESKHLNLHGKKADLIERIEEWFEHNA